LLAEDFLEGLGGADVARAGAGGKDQDAPSVHLVGGDAQDAGRLLAAQKTFSKSGYTP
jgi:hypothetical protein